MQLYMQFFVYLYILMILYTLARYNIINQSFCTFHYCSLYFSNFIHFSTVCTLFVPFVLTVYDAYCRSTRHGTAKTSQNNCFVNSCHLSTPPSFSIIFLKSLYVSQRKSEFERNTFVLWSKIDDAYTVCITMMGLTTKSASASIIALPGRSPTQTCNSVDEILI